MLKTKSILLASLVAFGLPACATAKRGAEQVFIVRTTPSGAKVETTLLAGKKIWFSQKEYDRIKSGESPEPVLKFKSCEATPCQFELSRKLEFDIHVSKPGYVSKSLKIDHFHRKEIAKQINKEVALKTAAAGTAAGALGAGFAASAVSTFSFGTATASAGTIATGAAVFAAPVLGVGLISYGVDSSTGANYDYWPNPAALTLEAGDAETADANSASYESFDAARRVAIIRPVPSPAQARAEQKLRDEDRAKRLETGRLFVDFDAYPPPEPLHKPQSSRYERRQEKRRKREAEREAERAAKTN